MIPKQASGPHSLALPSQKLFWQHSRHFFHPLPGLIPNQFSINYASDALSFQPVLRLPLLTPCLLLLALVADLNQVFQFQRESALP